MDENEEVLAAACSERNIIKYWAKKNERLGGEK